MWFLTKSRLEKLPIWKESEEEPPLSIGRAISQAKKWAVSKGASPNCFFEAVTFRSFSLESLDNKNRSVFLYYSIW